jgi:hypothetical protein
VAGETTTSNLLGAREKQAIDPEHASCGSKAHLATLVRCAFRVLVGSPFLSSCIFQGSVELADLIAQVFHDVVPIYTGILFKALQGADCGVLRGGAARGT